MDNLSKEVIAKIKRNISNSNRKDKEKFGIPGDFTYNEFVEIYNEQCGKCYVCKQDFKFDGGNWCYFFPSADRIYNLRRHTKDNIAISCLFCNIRMYKQVTQKKCSLCDGLNHIYEGEIITKSKLFRQLGNNNFRIVEYSRNFNKNNFNIDDEYKILVLQENKDNEIKSLT